jgi:Mg-chelatase subunit ChlD
MLRNVMLVLPFLAFSLCLRSQTISECKQHTIIVNVLQANGIPVRGLTINNLRASSRGRDLDIVSAQFMENPTGRIVVLLDVSGSMRGDILSNKWKIALAAASEFVASAPDRSQISLMTFADGIKEKVDAAAGREAISDWLRSLVASEPASLKGRTALYDAILETLKGMQPPQVGNAIYVITDGGENESSATMARVGRELQSQGTRLFAFLLASDRTEEEKNGASDLYELTHQSGGFTIGVGARAHGRGASSGYDFDNRVITAIRTSARIMGAEIGGYYSLVVRSQDSISSPQGWKLEVVDARGIRRKDGNLAYPSKLLACSF